MFKKFKDMAALVKAAGLIGKLRKESEMDSKGFWKSKTFWLNLLSLAGTLGGVLPEKYALPTLAVVNIALRFVSNQPLNVFPQKD